jgi:hypothetical protein
MVAAGSCLGIHSQAVDEESGVRSQESGVRRKTIAVGSRLGIHSQAADEESGVRSQESGEKCLPIRLSLNASFSSSFRSAHTVNLSVS